ncbi:helix-turn-helix domain-containing protein [Pyramidobacter piscolens]|uniref:helix-turn-helix domain-containing protein n=1 Tax=Pyramidobacter piscolens TaxID=638849 RepID=UPI002AB2167A|nr:helix-turn-helix transcriptional regulator [Pyramidobacter piscolens]
MSTFATRLKLCRQSKGITQAQAAEAFSIGSRHWQAYEGGTRTPTFDGLIQIADFFNVSIDWLVGRTDNPKINQ